VIREWLRDCIARDKRNLFKTNFSCLGR